MVAVLKVSALFAVLLVQAGILIAPISGEGSFKAEGSESYRGMEPPVEVEVEEALFKYNTPDLTARGWQPGEGLFDEVKQGLVGMLDQPHHWENKGHTMAGLNAESRRQRLENMARGVLNDHLRVKSGEAADHTHISMAARRLSLAVALELDERAALRGSDDDVIGGDDVIEDNPRKTPQRPIVTGDAQDPFVVAPLSKVVVDDVTENTDEKALNIFVSKLPFVSDAPSPSPYEDPPAREDYSQMVIGRMDAVNPTGDELGYRLIDDSYNVVKSAFSGVWGRCVSARCSGIWLGGSGLNSCVQTRWIKNKRTPVLLKSIKHFSTMKHYFAKSLSSAFPRCGCSSVSPYSFSNIHVYGNMAEDPEPENMQMIRPVCFGVDILGEYPSLSNECKRSLGSHHLQPTERTPSPTVCMCFNQKAVAAGMTETKDGLPSGSILDSDVVRHISSTLGLGCTSFIGPSGVSSSPQFTLGPAAKAEDATPALTQVKMIWKEQKDSVLGLASLLGKYVSLFKWQVVFGVIPKPGMTIVMLGLNARESIRILLKFGLKLIYFVAKIVMDIVRVMFFTVSAVSPSLAHTFQASQSAIKEEVGRLRSAVQQRFTDKDALRGFDPRELNIDTLLNLAGAEHEGSSLVSDVEALAESADCEMCNAMLILSAAVPTPDVWSTLLRIATLDLVGVGLGTQPNPSFTGTFLLQPCTACISSSIRLGRLIKRQEKYWEMYASSCNAVSVGMCYALSTLRHIHHARMIAPHDLDGHAPTHLNFCNSLPHTYFDLYRSRTKVPGEVGDIHCGTPVGTPTPGVPFKNMCLASYRYIQQFWRQPRSPFRTLPQEPYNEYEACLAVLKCERTGADFTPVSRDRLVRSELVEKVKDRVLDALWNLDMSDMGGDAFIGTMRNVVSNIREGYKHAQTDEINLHTNDLWSYGPDAIFSMSEWARPECLNVRIDSVSAMAEGATLWRSRRSTLLQMMIDRQLLRKETIESTKSLELSPKEIGSRKCNMSNDETRESSHPVFDGLYCMIERAKDASMNAWRGNDDTRDFLLERNRGSLLKTVPEEETIEEY